MAPFAISGLPSPYTETQLVICILTESFKWIFCWNRKFLHMWRNFRCLHMTDVEKSENLHIWHVCDVENVTIYTKFMLFSWKNQFCQNLRTLSRNPFCRNLRTFVWRKIYPKNFYVEKKWQIWGLTKTWITKNFQMLYAIQGTTMWMLTSWGYQNCGTFWVYNFLKGSY